MSKSPPVRIGCVPYLNSKVLIYGLESRGPGYTLELHTPSLLARKLRDGEVDIALVSSIEYFRNDRYLILPGLSVSGHQEMWSIRLFYRGALERLHRVALDPASETTNALLRIVLREKHKLKLEFVPLERGEDPVSRSELDGFLKIGDPALAFAQSGYEALDLMSEWRAFTGLPFVFAVWLVRKDVDLGRIQARLAQARLEGLQNAKAIARAHFGELGISFERALEYITRIVHYDLDPEELAGLRRFGELASQQEGPQGGKKLEFYE